MGSPHAIVSLAGRGLLLGPGKVLAYVRGQGSASAGHNPLGGWSAGAVIALARAGYARGKRARAAGAGCPCGIVARFGGCADGGSGLVVGPAAGTKAGNTGLVS